MRFLECDQNIDGQETVKAFVDRLRNNGSGARAFGWFMTIAGTVVILLLIVAVFRNPLVIRRTLPFDCMVIWLTAGGPMAISYAGIVRRLVSTSSLMDGLGLIRRLHSIYDGVLVYWIVGLVGALVLYPAAVPIALVAMLVNIRVLSRDRNTAMLIESQWNQMER